MISYNLTTGGFAMFEPFCWSVSVALETALNFGFG